ncbi:MAG: imidazole glycerol phosphate synthase subunit HisH [Gammaproteobacteria bacterium]
MESVVVIDYGMSNLRSVAKALERVGEGRHRVLVTSDPRALREAARVVFPGQGAIADCMRQLRAMQLIEPLCEAIGSRPFLGICLGLQTLMERSEEGGGTPGLGLYPGSVVRFPHPLLDPASGERLKVPHMGWNEVWPDRPHALWQGIEPGARFYFVHSYFVRPCEELLSAAHTDHGARFTSALSSGNVFAVQFHPEKSQRAGLQLLRNFLNWQGA